MLLNILFHLQAIFVQLTLVKIHSIQLNINTLSFSGPNIICIIAKNMNLTLSQVLLLLAMISLSLTDSCLSNQYKKGKDCAYCNPRCQTCTSDTVCSTCFDQMYLTVKDNALICIHCTQIISGCFKCSSDSVCEVCLDGYILNSQSFCDLKSSKGGAIPLSQNLQTYQHQNQLQTETQSSIVVCSSYEVNINGVCKPAMAFCLNYDNQGNCQTCQDGYILMNGYCIPASLISGINSLSPQDTNQNMAASQPICNSRQYKENGVCVDVGVACITFTPQGKCIQCDVGFTIFRGLCVQGSSSDSTVVSYIPKSKKGSDQKSNDQTNAITYQTNSASLNNANQSSNSDTTPMNLSSNTDNQISVDSSSSPNTSSLTSQPACNSPCLTCSSDPSFCLSCLDGFASVDQLPGQCFAF